MTGGEGRNSGRAPSERALRTTVPATGPTESTGRWRSARIRRAAAGAEVRTRTAQGARPSTASSAVNSDGATAFAGDGQGPLAGYAVGFLHGRPLGIGGARRRAKGSLGD